MKRFIAVAGVALILTGCEHQPVVPADQQLGLAQPHRAPIIRGPLAHVSAGEDFSCAIGSDGHARCWGKNFDFQSSAPKTAVFSHISAGTDQACAVAGAGVWCWGAFRSYEGGGVMYVGSYTAVTVGGDFTCMLRDDATVLCLKITNAAYPTPAGTFQQISAGGVHACGVHTDQTLECWTNINGLDVTTPSGTFKNVSAGKTFSVDCAVRTDGTLACWGDNGQGQLNVPTGTFVEVGVGRSFACALRTAGAIACWGNNANGAATPPGGVFSQLSVGDSHSCAVRSDGMVVCWGTNAHNQSTGLIAGSFAQLAMSGSFLCGVSPSGTLSCSGANEFNQSNPPAGSFAQVTTGASHGCAVASDASVRCWGRNGNGEATPPSGAFTQVSAGFAYTCGLRTNQIPTCWGDLNGGRNAVPSGAFSEVAAGNSHICAIRSDQTIACWGLNTSGQATAPSGTFIQLSAGSSHTCGITSAQSVVCWGRNTEGQSTAPTGTFTKIALASDHSCALTTDGSVVCWGFPSEALRVPNGEFTGISAGSGQTCALKWDHSMECWGDRVLTNFVPSNRAPVITSMGGPYSAGEGTLLTFTAAARDPDDDGVTYTWNFGDGSSASGAQVSHAFTDNRQGGFDVTLTADDGHGETASAHVNAAISNVAPTLAPIGDAPAGYIAPVCTTGRTLFTGGGRFTDPGSGDSWLVTADWGDGSTIQPIAPSVPPHDPQSQFTGEFSLGHCYANGATYTISVRITDDDGGTDHVSTQFTANRPPIADVGGPYAVNEGASVILLGTATDADNDPLTFAWDLDGDATFETPGQNVVFSAAALDGPSSRSVALRVCDPADACDTRSASITIANVAPTATLGAPAFVSEGNSFTISLSGPRDVPADVGALQYRFDCGTGFGSWSSAANSVCPTEDDGTRAIEAQIRDKDGSVTGYAASVVVQNVAPTATFEAPASAREGDSFLLRLTNAHDVAADMAELEYRFNCGTAFGAWSAATSISCPTDDNGTRAAAAQIRDQDGGVSTYSASVAVANAAPTLGAITVPVDPVPAGTPVTATALFSDPGTADTHTGFVQWDLGAPFDAALPGVDQAAMRLTATRSFDAGVYTIALRVRDDDGAEATATAPAYVVVFDPSAGFVTGGGWIMSPTGAYDLNPSLVGKASFGFVAKYQKGANAPTGNTEFQFAVGNLRFNSTSYDWLVVAGAQAKYKGVGKVNGVDGYGFMITAHDGDLSGGSDADTFRIKIWSLATGTVVYDNKRGEGDDSDAATQLGGGSIVIHK